MALGVALPLGDEQALEARRYSIVPQKGQSVSASWFQKEIETAHRSGAWIPKILLLPDVGKFEIKLNAYNAALLANGILTRYPSEVTLYKNRNRKMNRYLIYCYWRLFKALGTKKFWTIATNLIRNSSCYMAVCMHSVDKNIYRKLRQRDLVTVIKRINQLRANFHFKESLWSDEVNPLKAMRHYMTFFRVYIPKSENAVRPLGVPTRAWRIYNKMWLIPLMGYTGHLIPQNFHGYIPRRGTATAWQQILTTVIHKQSIFEVDFKQFFPSVPTADLTYALYLEGHVPLSVCVYLHYMNNSIPQFLDEDKMPEVHYGKGHELSLVLDQLKLKLQKPVFSERELPGVSTTGVRDPHAQLVNFSYKAEDRRPYSYMQPGVIPGIKPAEIPNTLQSGKLLKSELLPKLPEYIELDLYPVKFDLNFEMLKWRGSRGIPLNRPLTDAQRAEMNHDLRDKATTVGSQYAEFMLGQKGPFMIGLPQGGGLSPYLSILYLEVVLKRIGIPKGIDYLFFADDGIFYSDDHDLLAKFLAKISGGRELPTTLAHYNINIHPEKSGYVKANGVWKTPLKFLGLKLTPAASLAEFRLEAVTRGKLRLTDAGFVLKKSTLLFDKYELVSYTYLKGLLKEGKGYLQYKLDNSRLPMTKFYYHSLLVMYEINPFVLDYLYLLTKVVSSGIGSLYLFLSSSFYQLRSYETIVGLLPYILSDNPEDSLKFIELSTLDPKDTDKINRVCHLLKGGYGDSYMQTHATQNLLSRLEKGLGSINLRGLPARVPDPVSESLRNLLSADYFFGLKIQLGTLITRVVSKSRGMFSFVTTEILPLDLYRFLVTVLIPLFSILVKPLPWVETESTKSSKDPDSLAHHQSIHRHHHRLSLAHGLGNLAKSDKFGLIMSRLYGGSWLLDEFEQSFEYTCERDSLAEFLQVQDIESQLNIFVGSSYGFHEIVRLSSHLKRTSRTRAPFVLFKDGFLSSDSWSLGVHIELASPSLSQEFPGGYEPIWQ